MAQKPLRTVGISEGALRDFVNVYDDPRRASALEDRIADLLGIEHGDVALAARQFFGKLQPQDVMLYSRRRDELVSLFEREPHHRESLRHQYLGLFALRVAVPEDARSAAVDRWREIVDMLFPKGG